MMNLEINSVEKMILLTALEMLHNISNDTEEVGKISDLIDKVESLAPSDRSIAVMDEEGRLYVDGEEMTPEGLGF